MALVIAATDTHQDGSNATSTDIDVTLPAYSIGDLVIICYELWNNSGTPTVTWTTAPNGETVTDIVNGYGASGADGLQLCIGWYIATANYAGGDMANDSTVSTRWTAAVVIVPAGEFDATTPIGATGGAANSASDVSDITMASFSAGSTDGGGKLLAFVGSDQDPFNATMPSGYTALEILDIGRAVMLLAGRDTAITNSETIGTAVFDLNGAAADAMAVYAFIVREVVPQTAPTVALNSPADASSGSDTTPTLDFTGTDAEGDSVRYEVQVFDADPSSSTLLDSYSETNKDTDQPVYGAGNSQIAQDFTGNGGNLHSCKFYLKKGGLGASPTGTAVAKLYASTGTPGTNATPTGSALATSDSINVATDLTTSYQLIEFTFASPYTLSNATDYFVAFEFTGGDSFNFVALGDDASSPSHGGNYARYSGSWAAISSIDVCFYVYATPGSLLDKVSGTDSGFANPDNGGDTDPFNSGENIQFTVQAGDALAADTYYWRVRGIDPTGSNTYGAWSSTRSFEVTSGGGGDTVAISRLMLMGVGQ